MGKSKKGAKATTDATSAGDNAPEHTEKADLAATGEPQAQNPKDESLYNSVMSRLFPRGGSKSPRSNAEDANGEAGDVIESGEGIAADAVPDSSEERALAARTKSHEPLWPMLMTAFGNNERFARLYVVAEMEAFNFIVAKDQKDLNASIAASLKAQCVERTTVETEEEAARSADADEERGEYFAIHIGERTSFKDTIAAEKRAQVSLRTKAAEEREAAREERRKAKKVANTVEEGASADEAAPVEEAARANVADY